eukprot:2234128-Pyramimonas_sp.AAC.1
MGPERIPGGFLHDSCAASGRRLRVPWDPEEFPKIPSASLARPRIPGKKLKAPGRTRVLEGHWGVLKFPLDSRCGVVESRGFLLQVPRGFQGGSSGFLKDYRGIPMRFLRAPENSADFR